jgi:division protein CdvB (Snf7/Vps24/ESCRT-III family)
MKRERNSFFSNYTAQNTSYIPNIPQNMPMPNIQQPFFNSNNESSYYQSNDIANYNDIENRINKLERIVNRLDSRVTKLENTSNLNNQPETTNNYSNMYML